MNDVWSDIRKALPRLQNKGVMGYSTIETRRLLGINQGGLFRAPKTPGLILPAWFLSTLDAGLLEAQNRFVMTFLFPSYSPGLFKNQQELNKALDFSRIQDKNKRYLELVLCKGVPVSELGLPKPSEQTLCRSAQTVVANTLYLQGRSYDLEQIMQDVGNRVNRCNAWFLMQLVTHSSIERERLVRAGRSRLSSPEAAAMNLLRIMPIEQLHRFEEMVDRFFDLIERYRYEHGAFIQKLSPLMNLSRRHARSKNWLSYFDGNTRAPVPFITDIKLVYDQIKEFDKQGCCSIRKRLVDLSPPGSRVTFYPFYETYRRIEEGEILSQAAKSLLPSMHFSQFYRAYNNWLNNDEIRRYWLID